MNGIVYVTWLKEWVDYQFVDDIIITRLSITKSNTYPMLSDISKLKGGNRDAMIRMADKDGQMGLNALAVVYEKNVHLLLFKLLRLFLRDTIPTRFFRNNSAALKWLAQFK